MSCRIRRIVLSGFTCCVLLGTPAARAQVSVKPSVEPSVGHSMALPKAPGLGDLFAQAAKDLVRIPTKDNLVTLAIGGALATATHLADAPVTRGLSGAQLLEEPLEPGEFMGGAIAQFGGALATYSLGRATGSARVAVGADLVRAQLVTQALTQGLKFAVGRTRPDGASRSFPSGHTSTTFATATVLQQHFGWKAGVPAYALATYVAANRLQSKRHYLSDVIFGATLGIVSARSITLGRGGHRFAMSPMVTPGGAGLAFVRIGGR